MKPVEEIKNIEIRKPTFVLANLLKNLPLLLTQFRTEEDLQELNSLRWYKLNTGVKILRSSSLTPKLK